MAKDKKKHKHKRKDKDAGTVALARTAQAGAAERRVARLRAACAEAGLDAFLVRDVSDIAWATAFDDVFDDEDAHALLVTPDLAVLHTDSRYSAAARGAAAAECAVLVDDGRATHAVFALGALGASPALSRGRRASRRARLGFDDRMSLAEFRALKEAAGAAATLVRLRDTSGLVVGLRAVKEQSEVARMRAAQAVTDAAFAHIVGFMRPGMTEREVQVELEGFMRKAGAEGLAFSSIVAAGPHAASPHAVAGETRLEAGQCVVMDFGAKAQGYCSDMTRTVFLGEPDERLRRAYQAIRDANEQVEAAIAPGVTGRAMHELAERVLADAGFAGAMGHGLGHGVGIDVHEQPTLSPRNDRPLVAGNVVTVEPGIYVPGEFGMRLEDCGVVTEEGFVAFTQSPHDPVIL